ncbi:MAG: DUF3316 domain-containing protein [Tannerella sp.]|jgi:hypothetical protein|nr:DUF3316 domain-containing protein [Tannerella sp.]
MKKIICFTTFLIFLHIPLMAQNDAGEPPPYSVNEGMLVGYGTYNVRNSYVTEPSYTGKGISVLNDRMKLISWMDYHISSQQIFHAELSDTENPASTISALSGYVDYSHGYHYRFQPVDKLKVLAGVNLSGLLGFFYNTHNGNNSIAMNADIDLNLSAIAIYAIPLKHRQLTLRLQSEMAVAGALFAPGYEQSYYEIFSLGNTDGIVSFSSLHNKTAIRNYFTVDLPVRNLTLRTGYLNNIYYTDIHGIKIHKISHSIMIGLVKEFNAFGGRKLKSNSFRSAYY